MWTTMRPFNERLREAAAYASVEYSQTAIANSLGIRKQTVDRWFSGYEPRPAMLFHMADRWGVDARWLATEEGEMIPKRRVRRAAVVVLTAMLLSLSFAPQHAADAAGSPEAVYYVKSVLRWLRRVLVSIQYFLTDIVHGAHLIRTTR